MFDFEELKNAMANLEEEVLAIMEEITEDTIGDAVAAMQQGMDLVGKLFDSLKGLLEKSQTNTVASAPSTGHKKY